MGSSSRPIRAIVTQIVGELRLGEQDVMIYMTLHYPSNAMKTTSMLGTVIGVSSDRYADSEVCVQGQGSNVVVIAYYEGPRIGVVDLDESKLVGFF